MYAKCIFTVNKTIQGNFSEVKLFRERGKLERRWEGGVGYEDLFSKYIIHLYENNLIKLIRTPKDQRKSQKRVRKNCKSQRTRIVCLLK